MTDAEFEAQAKQLEAWKKETTDAAKARRLKEARAILPEGYRIVKKATKGATDK